MQVIGSSDQAIRLFTLFSAVFRTGLLTVCNASRIQGTADDVITYTRKVSNTTASD